VQKIVCNFHAVTLGWLQAIIERVTVLKLVVDVHFDGQLYRVSRGKVGLQILTDDLRCFIKCGVDAVFVALFVVKVDFVGVFTSDNVRILSKRYGLPGDARQRMENHLDA